MLDLYSVKKNKLNIKLKDTSKDWVIGTNINLLNFKQIVDECVKDQHPINDKTLSTHGPKSLQFSINENGKINTVSDSLAKVILAIFKQIDKNYNFNLKLKAAWTIYGQKYGFHTFHCHDNGDQAKTYNVLSTVLFLEVPEKIEIDLPGSLSFVLRDENNKVNVEPYTVNKGDFFIFPAHVFHGTYPQSEGLRQTLNLEFIID